LKDIAIQGDSHPNILLPHVICGRIGRAAALGSVFL
jgi:hypothetical protein